MQKQVIKEELLQWDVNELTTRTALLSSNSEFFNNVQIMFKKYEDY